MDPIGLIQPQSSTQPSVNNNANHQALTETVDESDKSTIKKTTAVHVGEGLPPIPGRIADKIVRWEYVDMWELLPEYWSNPTGIEGLDNYQLQPRDLDPIGLIQPQSSTHQSLS